MVQVAASSAGVFEGFAVVCMCMFDDFLTLSDPFISQNFAEFWLLTSDKFNFCQTGPHPNSSPNCFHRTWSGLHAYVWAAWWRDTTLVLTTKGCNWRCFYDFHVVVCSIWATTACGGGNSSEASTTTFQMKKMFIFNLAADSLPWTLGKPTKSPSKEKAERAAECQHCVCKLYAIRNIAVCRWFASSHLMEARFSIVQTKTWNRRYHVQMRSCVFVAICCFTSQRLFCAAGDVKPFLSIHHQS